MAFEFTSPETIDEAIALYADGARWLAGGTDLVPEFKTGLTQPTRLVNLKHLEELRRIEVAEDACRIGALATLTEIARDPRLQREYSALAQACTLSASPQIRHAGTIGGNICQDSRCPYYRGDFFCYLKGGETCFMREGANSSAAVVGYQDCVHVHPSDPANALVALDAEIVLRGRAGERVIHADQFFSAPHGDQRRMNALAPDEIVLAIRLPRQVANARSVYIKAMERATWTFALASVAVRVVLNNDQVQDARLVLGGIAPVPWRESQIEPMLRGRRLDDLTVREVSGAVLREAAPLVHNAYKVRLARALVKRALQQLASAAAPGDAGVTEL